MKQKKKKDEPSAAGPSAAATAADEQQQQQLLCNGGEPRPKKSALKRTTTGGSTAKSAKSGKNKRHVQFNEGLNVFFESDYVIVIRDDDCDFDEEDFDFWSQQPCSCGDDSCFQPWLDDDDRGLPPLDPYEQQPATLSPPDGYKDGCFRHVPSLNHHKYADDDLTTRYDSAMTDHCTDMHVTMPYNPTSYFEDNQKHRTELSSPPRFSKDEVLQQQQTATTTNAGDAVQPKPNTVCDTASSAATAAAAQLPRCIVETITMTTVTERRIVQETRPADAVQPTTTTTTTTSAVVAEEPKAAADEGYVMIKCGNNTVLYNNRNPNSAVRQLFPATKFVCPPTRIKETDDARLLNKYLITEESLRAFDSRSLNGGGVYKSNSTEQHSDDDDDDTSNSLIRRTIERSTLRRNTSAKKKNDIKEISLIEKIRRLTCDSDEDADDPKKQTGPEQAAGYTTVLVQCESVQPAPAYKKLTELFGGGGARYESQQPTTDVKPAADGLDLCDGHAAGKTTPRTVVAGKPFLSTLATACVTGSAHPIAGTVAQPSQCPQPDVVAGTQTPGSSHRGQEELAAFVQQDSSRLEKIRKRYMPASATTATAAADDEDDENDDYGFNRRPEVHGIRSGFSAQITIKNHVQRPPPRPSSYSYGPTARPPDQVVQPDFVPCRYPVRIQGGDRAPPPYPAAAQRSVIRVTHGQQQTIRVPYQAVGPVQVHLLTAAANAAVTHPSAVRGHHVTATPNEYLVQHGHTRIHHGQQFVIARGTQTAAISTTRYYQLPPPPPLNSQQQHPLPLPPPQQTGAAAFQSADVIGAPLQYKQTSPTKAVAARQSQEFADHNLPSVSQPPKNPVLFYGMNV